MILWLANSKFISISWILRACYDRGMRDLVVLFLHLLGKRSTNHVLSAAGSSPILGP
jgi:hypothetical protein